MPTAKKKPQPDKKPTPRKRGPAAKPRAKVAKKNQPTVLGVPERWADKMEELLARLAAGENLREICRDEKMPSAPLVKRWVMDDPSGFGLQYARAREIGYLDMADEILEIADDGRNDWMERNDPDNPGYEINGEHVQRSRERINARKWMLSKVLPKIFGDRIEHDVTLTAGRPIDEVEIQIVWPDDRRPEGFIEGTAEEQDD